MSDNPFAPDLPRVWPWAATAAVVAVALLGGVAAEVLQDDPATAAPTLAATAPADRDVVLPAPPEAENAPADFAPADVAWVDLRGVRTPLSADHGPHDTADGRALGFSDDDLGAVMAAVHLLARTEGLAGEDVYRPTILEQTTDNGYLLQVADDVNTQQAQALGAPPGQSFDALAPTEVVGWRLRPGTGESDVVVVVTLGTTVGDAYRLASVAAPMVRDEDQWKLVAPATGTFEVTPTVDLAGVTVFPDARP